MEQKSKNEKLKELMAKIISDMDEQVHQPGLLESDDHRIYERREKRS